MSPDTFTSPKLDLGLLQLNPSADGDTLFRLSHVDLDALVSVGGPAFELDGALRGRFGFVEQMQQRALPSGGMETVLRYASADVPGLGLLVFVRSFSSSPVLRIKYRLSAEQPMTLTKSDGADNITYFTLAQPGFSTGALNAGSLAEYQLSHFDQVIHSYMPNREERAPDEVLPGQRFVGPVAVFHTAGQAVLAAFEHGADHPNAFIDFHIAGAGEDRTLVVQAVKGNYYHGQIVDSTRVWESVWFELGLQAGGLEAFLPAYRRFFLEEVCEIRESRRPNIYYNTWNYQERQKYFKDRPFIESMTAERMLQEIDVAHRLGVDVFVIDTGWYIKTGDWLPNLEKFPEGLKEIKRRLDEYGMQLGLWFNPTVAARTSRVYQQHPEWQMTRKGESGWWKIWETEESTGMCLASDYADYYVEVMVRLHEELGVSYFKWDAVQQYGCDSPLHNHGTQENTPEERADCYAYQMGLSMIRIVEAAARRCPGIIVDFDITEGGRFVGLGFLSAGKYFLVNNGPYFHEFDIPHSVKIDPDTINVFFYPGPARPRICRQGIKFDELIPSILFLTHYLPDSPQLSQRNSIASLVLGGNGFWGDLPALSEDDVDYLSGQITLYKRVAEAVTCAFPRIRGFPGSSPEIYEKLDPETSSGMVVFFTVTPGQITHYTQPLNPGQLGEVIGADSWESVDGGRLKITVDLERNDARVVYVMSK
jgi:alpha-galactosidase